MPRTLEEVLDVTDLIETGAARSLLVRVVLLCAMVAFLVGLDTSSINVAAPLIAGKLQVSQAFLGPIFSAALLGALLGALTFGSIADRLGRKQMLIFACVIFGVFTLLTAVAASFRAFLLIRFLAGVGLGGATPCLITLTSEYASRSQRAAVTSLVWTGFPCGVITGSFLNAFLLSKFGWPAIFLAGGLFPLILSVALMIWLPESIRFLLTRNPNDARARQIVSRIVASLHDGVRISAQDEQIEGASLRSLFARGRAPETVVLWFLSLITFGSGLGVFFWAPTLMLDHNIALPRAATIMGFSGLGALAGCAIAGTLIRRFGAMVILAPTFLLGALTTAILGQAANSLILVTLDLVMCSTMIGGLGPSGVLAVTSGAYPPAMRSTGVGWATGMGRLGEMLSPLLTGMLMSTGWKLNQVFLLTSLILVLGALCTLLLGWYAPRSRTTKPTAA